MPYVQVYVDTCDVLDDLSDDELRAELQKRNKKRGKSDFDSTIPVPIARDTLDQVAHTCRKNGQYDLAYKLDEIRLDYVEAR